MDTNVLVKANELVRSLLASEKNIKVNSHLETACRLSSLMFRSKRLLRGHSEESLTQLIKEWEFIATMIGQDAPLSMLRKKLVRLARSIELDNGFVQPSMESSAGIDVGAIPPTMCALPVIQYLSWLGSQHTGAGHIVDCGCWFGALGYSMAKTARSSLSKNAKRVYAFDSFRWEEWMFNFPQNLTKLTKVPKVGEDYLEFVIPYWGEVSDLILPIRVFVDKKGFDVQQDDAIMPEISWGNGSIEMLCYDMGSYHQMLEKVWEVFSPHLIDGATVVFHEYGKLESVEIREFCEKYASSLKPKHGPVESLRSFLFTR